MKTKQTKTLVARDFKVFPIPSTHLKGDGISQGREHARGASTPGAHRQGREHGTQTAHTQEDKTNKEKKTKQTRKRRQNKQKKTKQTRKRRQNKQGHEDKTNKDIGRT